MTGTIQIQDFDDPDYDPFHASSANEGGEMVATLHEEFARLRRIAPVHIMDPRAHFGAVADRTLAKLRHVAVLGHEAAMQVLADPGTFSNQVYKNNLGVAFGRSISTMDAPEHGRYRRLFQKAFMPREIGVWGETMVPRIMHRLIDGFEKEGRAELVRAFTLLFPFHFIHELMGLPDEHRLVFQKLAFAQIFLGFDPAHAREAIDKLQAYIKALVAERRTNPVSESDFVSIIANAEIEGERLPDDVVIGFFRQLMNAGGDTSYHGFSNVLTGLLCNPDQFEAVKGDRSLAPTAIEEGLRWNAPVLSILRQPTREAVVGGVEVGPKDVLDVVLASANRDETVYLDPDRFDIFRKAQRHNAFAYGAHVCIGQHLARMEMRIALETLMERLPRLRLDERHPMPEVRGLALRGPHALHVRFD